MYVAPDTTLSWVKRLCSDTATVPYCFIHRSLPFRKTGHAVFPALFRETGHAVFPAFFLNETLTSYCHILYFGTTAVKSNVSDIFHKDMKKDHTQVAMVMASCLSASRLEVDVLQSTCN